MRIQKTIIIERSPEDVWAFTSDARNDPRWCHKVRSVAQVAGNGPGPDAKYNVLHSPRPLRPPVALSVEVVEYVQPRRLGWREEDRDGVFNVVYELEPVVVGTRLTQTNDIEWKISKLAFPIARMMVSRDLSRQLSALKELLESRVT